MEPALARPPAPAPFGLPVLAEPVPLAETTLDLVRLGIASLWSRIEAAAPLAGRRPLLLSYDVHPSPEGPVLIEVNTNASGIATAIQAAREINVCCADWEQDVLEGRLLELFRRDLLGDDPAATGVVAIVDDDLATQALLPEMHALADLLRRQAPRVLVLDAAALRYADGRLRHGDVAVDRVYWRSTDFLVAEPRHAAVRRAVAEGSTVLAPSPEAYAAIADKRRFLDWSAAPELARDAAGHRFRIAETVPMTAKSAADWYAERASWVFKPASGHGSRGVYVGKSVSRQKLAELPAASYLAQRYAPHPLLDRDGRAWKYDIRFYADRGAVIGAAARVFQGQVVGMRGAGSGFAPVRIGDRCCLVSALRAAPAP